jgi:outer membrane lipoprotein-sorting protein
MAGASNNPGARCTLQEPIGSGPLNIKQHGWVALAVVLWINAMVPVAKAELSLQDKDDIARVEYYLNSVKTLSADFIQISPDSSISRGRFYLKRPGRLRFEYDPPAPILIVADGTYVNYFDVELGQLSQIGVYSTSLGIIVAKKVNLDERIAVTSVKRDAAVISLTTIDTEEPGRGTLTLIFSERPLELRKWKIIDPQGLLTTIALDKVSINRELDPGLFIFHQPDSVEDINTQ